MLASLYYYLNILVTISYKPRKYFFATRNREQINRFCFRVFRDFIAVSAYVWNFNHQWNMCNHNTRHKVNRKCWKLKSCTFSFQASCKQANIAFNFETCSFKKQVKVAYYWRVYNHKYTLVTDSTVTWDKAMPSPLLFDDTLFEEHRLDKVCYDIEIYHSFSIMFYCQIA